MALGKAQGVTALEAETAVNKFWVNNYATLVDAIKEKLGAEEGRKLAYDAYHTAVFNACAPSWEKMKGTNPDAQAYAEWLITDLDSGLCSFDIHRMSMGNPFSRKRS